jgi:hypothetical protein
VFFLKISEEKPINLKAFDILRKPCIVSCRNLYMTENKWLTLGSSDEVQLQESSSLQQHRDQKLS